MWEIFAYGNVEVLTQVFNAAAMLMNSGDYLGLIKVVTLVAFIAVFIGALSHERFGGFKWFISAMVMYMILFVPKVQVLITDRLALSGPQTVDNVPFGMAVFGHITSKVGDYLARSFDTVFTLPNNMKYTTSGMLFANRVMEKTRLLGAENQRLSTNVHTFIRACTYYDIIQGNVDVDQLRSSPIGGGDAWAIMGTTNPGRMTNYINASNVTSTIGCDVAWRNISNDINGQNDTWFEKLGRGLHPTMPAAAAAAAIQGEIVDVYTVMTGVAASAQEVVRQNYIINSLYTNGALTAVELGDSSSSMLSYATAQAQSTAKTNYGTTANLAKEAMPLIRNAIEVILYAIFPLTFLLTLMPVQTALNALKGFVMGLLWVQLWAPLYAVLNMLATLKTASDLGGATAGSNLTMRTAMDISSTVFNNTDVAGFLVISIPVIAMAIVKGGEMLLSSAAGAAAQPVSGAAAGAASQVGAGTLALNTVQNDMWNAHKHDDMRLEAHNGLTMRDAYGSDTFDNRGNFVASQQNQSSTAASVKYSQAEQASMSTASRQMYAQAGQEGYSSLQQHQSSTARGHGATITKGSKEAAQFSELGQIAEQVNSRFGYGKNSSQGWQAVLGLGSSTLVQIGARGTHGEGASMTSANDYAKQAMAKSGIQDSREVIKNFQNSDEFKKMDTHTDQHAKNYSRDVRVAEGYDQEYKFASSINSGVERNLTTDAWQWAVKNGKVGSGGITSMSTERQAAILQEYKDKVIHPGFVNDANALASGRAQTDQRTGAPVNANGQVAIAQREAVFSGRSVEILGAAPGVVANVTDSAGVQAKVDEHGGNTGKLIEGKKESINQAHTDTASTYNKGADAAAEAIHPTKVGTVFVQNPLENVTGEKLPPKRQPATPSDQVPKVPK